MNAARRIHKATAIARHLTQIGFAELFQRLTDDTLDDIWDDGASQALLNRVVLDSARDPLARFLAAEVLFARLPAYPPASALPALASIYATALADNLAQMANPWGLPGDASAQLARHVLALGKVAIAAFAPLLTDARPVSYGGSRDATAGNRYDYRVKDIAASLIAAIRGETWKIDLITGVRDRAIERLRRRLLREEQP